MTRKAKITLTDEEIAHNARREARAAYVAMLERCKAAQVAFPKLYLLDEGVSMENASDGLFNNEGRKLSGYECDWDAIDFKYMTRHLEADTGMRMAEAGIDPNEYGIRY